LAVTLAITPNIEAGIQSGAFGSANTVRLEITNWAQVMKELQKLDKKYVSALRKDFKGIAKPVQTRIRKAIPSKAKPPLSGMRQVHFGRLAWGSTFGNGAKPSKSVVIQTPNTRSRKFRGVEQIPIVRLQVQSPATVLYDMAGRVNGVKGRKGYTPWYDYMYTLPGGTKFPGKRRHKVNPTNFLTKLARSTGYQKAKASRIVWPSAEKAMPEATKQMDMRITQVNMELNRRLRTE
jgi:hypothetical protein